MRKLAGLLATTMISISALLCVPAIAGPEQGEVLSPLKMNFVEPRSSSINSTLEYGHAYRAAPDMVGATQHSNFGHYVGDYSTKPLYGTVLGPEQGTILSANWYDATLVDF